MISYKTFGGSQSYKLKKIYSYLIEIFCIMFYNIFLSRYIVYIEYVSKNANMFSEMKLPTVNLWMAVLDDDSFY